MHSFHLAGVPAVVGARAIARPPRHVPGMQHAECLATMRLGAPVVSPDRLQVHRLAVFARWDEEADLDRFLEHHPLGRRLAGGWHVRLEFLRRWGRVRALGEVPEIAGRAAPAEPVVAVTMARMRIPEVPRFVRWGVPVERLVRDDPAATLALAAYQPPRTVSTFSVWRSTREMTAMAHGRSDAVEPRRHADAMVERQRRDFHHEFTTLRFRPLAEHGSWEGRTGIVPGVR